MNHESFLTQKAGAVKDRKRKSFPGTGHPGVIVISETGFVIRS